MTMLPVGVAVMLIQVACADAYMLNTTLHEYLYVEIITSANRQSMALESFTDSDDGDSVCAGMAWMSMDGVVFESGFSGLEGWRGIIFTL